VRRTPTIRLEEGALGRAAGVWLKLELLQVTGSFKPRGAFNSLLAAEVPKAGVAAASGGNHGAAVAYAARALGAKATIFVPEVSSPAKVERIESYGADLAVHGARYAQSLAECEAFAKRAGALAIHAYDAPGTIAGQGTVGLEWEEQAPDLDTVLVAVGGGGLIAGVARWYERRVKVVGVEPRTSCALHAALAAGRPVDVEVSGVAVDSLGAARCGTLVYDIARAFVAEVALVSDEAIRAAQTELWRSLRLVTEPGGAAAYAALASGAYRPAPGERVGVLVCGANADLATFPA
jgi:threonine dehydratase